MAAKARTVDTTGVNENAGNYASNMRVPEGEYVATITDVQDKESKSGDPFWVYRLSLVARPRATYDFWVPLEGGSKKMWKLFRLFKVAGSPLRAGRSKVDPNKVLGKTIGVFLSDSEYNGKEQSEVGEIFEADKVVSAVTPIIDTDDAPVIEDDATPIIEADDDDDDDLSEIDLDDLA